MSHKDEADHLRRRAKEFVLTAEFQAGRGLFSLAALSLEQALQLHLKGELLARGIEFPRTHSVRRLLEMIAAVDKAPKLRRLTKRHEVDLGVLEDAYISSRYVQREYTKKQVETLKTTVREIMANVGPR